MQIFDNVTKIKFFPTIEFILFLVTSLLTFVVSNGLNANNWVPISFAILWYFIFLGRTNLIHLTDSKLKITFLNFIQGKHSIELKKIKKIWSTESYEQETDIDVETSYHLFRREYNLEYMDNLDKKRYVRFTISNRKKENKMLMQIRNCIESNVDKGTSQII